MAAQPSNGGSAEVAAADDSPAEQRTPDGDAADAIAEAGALHEDSLVTRLYLYRDAPRLL